MVHRNATLRGIGKITTSGSITEYELPANSKPAGITAGPDGNLWFTDRGTSKVGRITTSRCHHRIRAAQRKRTARCGTGPWRKSLVHLDTETSKIGKVNLSAWVGNAEAHGTKTIYYTAKEEASVLTCRNHPEWAGLPCETAPAAQPGTSGLPELPVKTITYNVWNEPETVTQTVGSTKRTTTNIYDEAGRLKTTATSPPPSANHFQR